MLVDLLIARAARGRDFDVHRSATLNCRIQALWARARRLLG